MQLDWIMQIGMALFFILFAFLLFVFFTAIASIFRRDKYSAFEPEVSVVIPAYNEERNIARCLDEVYALRYPQGKMEVIVVDDGSTDRTMRILQRYALGHGNLRIVKGKHKGKSAALNLGVEAAKHAFVMTIDADTFVDKESLARLIKPFTDKKAGATNGSCVAENDHNLLSVWQKIEYHYNNLIRRSFSVLFKNGIWFFGAFACYRKSVLKRIGGFKLDTMTEDMDTAMEIYRAGYRTINVYDALGFTVVPTTLRHFYHQRMRWWMGALQTLQKNKALFSRKSSPSILFLFISQYWWSFYAVISFPILVVQVYYWLPMNLGSFWQAFWYLFRWFTFAGPVYVIYKIPEWGINGYSIFGVVSGIISVGLIIWSIYLFKDRLGWKNLLGIFLYFPYTILLNSVIIVSLVKILFNRKGYFIH